MNANVFAPHGNTRRIIAIATDVATSAIRMTVTSDFLKADSYLITNFGPSVAFLGYGSSRTEAIDNAKVPDPDNATGKFCFIVPPGQRTLDALSKDVVYFAAITISGKADIFITPGRGIISGSLESGVSADNLNALQVYESITQNELLQAILIELKTNSFLLREGLNVAEDLDQIRGDQIDPII